MKFKELQFDDINAKRTYDNYFKSVRKVLRPIPEVDKQEVLMEFNSHIYEHIQSNKSKSELEVLKDAITSLGIPAEVLKPLVADKLMEKATMTFNPLHVFKALMSNLGNGIFYIIFFFFYLFLGSFVFLIFAKIFNPNNVGMFFKEGKFVVLGMTENKVNYHEVLGYWFIPVMMLLIVVLYLFLTFLLKLKKNNKYN